MSIAKGLKLLVLRSISNFINYINMMYSDNHIFKGLRRDVHPSRQDESFLWDALNVRLTNRDSDTGFSITNEKGNTDTGVVFDGQYVGHCVLNRYLVVFTVSQNDTQEVSRIYRLHEDKGEWIKVTLFEGVLGLDANHPLEILGDSESVLVNKLYWTDGINQPRVINITAPELKLPEDIASKVIVDGVNFSNPQKSEGVSQEVIENLEKWYEKGNWIYRAESPFDFVQNLQLKERVLVGRSSSHGEFSPGVIQYALTYFNKYGQESNIFYVSPIQYIRNYDRAGNPEEKVITSFTIKVENVDNFDYIRVYSIHRTSLDAQPTVKIVADLDLKDCQEESAEGEYWYDVFGSEDQLVKTIEYTDTGLTGSIEDPAKLLYTGGQTILAGTITSKEGVMFYGNITVQKNTKELTTLLQQEEAENGDSLGLTDCFLAEDTYDNQGINKYYPYLPQFKPGHFKAGETYRLGVQFQFKTGEWSEPIPLNKVIRNSDGDGDGFLDVELNNSYSWGTTDGVDTKELQLFPNATASLLKAGVRRARTCVVFPKPAERNIICQGVLNPTVYSVRGRHMNNPYAMSSWFFRPSPVYVDGKPKETSTSIDQGSTIQYKHNYTLFSGGNRSAEIQSSLPGDSNKSIQEIISPSDGIKSHYSTFAVDSNLVTLHSPEIEYGSYINTTQLEGARLNIVGAASLHGLYGDIDLAVTSKASSQAGGFIHHPVGFPVNCTTPHTTVNGGFVSSCCFEDKILRGDFLDEDRTGIVKYLVYPWHRTGSLNNDIVRSPEIIEKSGSDRTAILKWKIISNLKYFESKSTFFNSNNHNIKITTPKLFSSKEVTGLTVRVPHLDQDVLYFGNVDDIVSATSDYPIYAGTDDSISQVSPTNVSTSGESVRMKYKSSPHLVFSLYDEDNPKVIPVLPYTSVTGETITSQYTPSGWENNTSTSTSYPILSFIGSKTFYGTYNKEGNLVLDVDDTSVTALGTYQIVMAYIGPIAKRVLVKRVKIGEAGYWQVQNSGTKVTVLVKKGCIIYHHYVNGEWVGVLQNAGPIKWGPFENLQDGHDNFQYLGDQVLLNLKVSLGNIVGITSYKMYSEPSTDNTDNTFTIQNGTLQLLEEDKDYSPTLPIAELTQWVDPDTRFGGKSDEAIKNNLWVPSSESVPLVSTPHKIITIPYAYGDTWCTRYDCVKTYPFADDDTNQIVEIGSFMLESHINLDGRYDTKRGQLSNFDITPDSYKINEVYSQLDNFFNYRTLDKDYYKIDTFPYQVAWSLKKNPQSIIDPWTNVTLASTLDLPADKGSVTCLTSINDTLIGFQEKSISQIMFNSRVQLNPTDGVPIEIGNSNRVDGFRILSSTIGCANKWSIIPTSTGLFFIDNESKSIYRYGQELVNVSELSGMSQWVKNDVGLSEWTPTGMGVRSFVDNMNGDVYFSPAHGEEALCFSTKLNQFTSFLSYGETEGMFDFEGGFYSIKQEQDKVRLWENFTGVYNEFYGNFKPFSFTYISNGNSPYTKIFDTVEVNAEVRNFGQKDNSDKPFDFIQAENDYQKAYTDLTNSRDIRKKFNIWRINIPRSPYVAQDGKDVIRHYGRARIRNPWSEITLGSASHKNQRVTIYNVSTKYSM